MKKSIAIILSIMLIFAITFPAAAATTAKVDPLGKYSPEVTIKVANLTNSTVKYRQGESADNNVWMKAYKNTLSINIKFAWIVDEAQMVQKMNITIASNALPDIFPVYGQQLNRLIDSNSLADLTSAYQKYASPLTTQIVNEDKNVFELGKRGGKLYGIANTTGGSAIDQPAMLYIREDWRKKLNLPEPKTMDDFYAIADAFVNKDPDGNGKNDTIGLPLTKTLYKGDSGSAVQGLAGLKGFADAYHAYLGTWIKDASGKTVYGSIQPEVKVMLQKLKDMYNKGLLDKEFGVKDMAKAGELLAAGKAGMEFGQMWNPFLFLVTAKQNNKDAEWKSYPVPSSDNKPVKVTTQVTAYNFWVVRKGFKYPEAAIKMCNLWTEKAWGKTADNNMFNGDGSTYVPFKYVLPQVWPSMKNVNTHNKVVVALKNNDTSKLNVEEKSMYDQCQGYLKTGDPAKGWSAYKIFGHEASFDVINKYIANNMYLYDEYHNIPTPTMVTKLSTLDKMELEAFTKIIMRDPVSDFDKFVTNWKKLGGDAITKEMNAAK